jgi:signal transduction histidine kinase
MKKMKKIGYGLVVFVMLFGMVAQAWAGEGATREEAISKCLEAAKLLQSKGIDAAIQTINDKQGPFVWKDTYVFLMDMDGKMLAHPIKPELTQRNDLVEVKDTAGKPLFLEFIELANSKGQGWVDYMWPKPGQDKPVVKSSYIYRVPDTQYFVGAGIYK